MNVWTIDKKNVKIELDKDISEGSIRVKPDEFLNHMDGKRSNQIDKWVTLELMSIA